MSFIKEASHLQIPLQELSDATNGFSERNVIGRGGFGKVYKGVYVKYGGNIAIKVVDLKFGQGETEFYKEINILSVYKHKNIVSLLGFCDEDGHKILVYEYVSNRSLDLHLDYTNLTWIHQLRISLDAARGIQYLHDGDESRYIVIHRDIKSSNILLDENWKAKIADFGLSKIDPVNMQSNFYISGPCGTIGYCDPDYIKTGILTTESDVYSLGVVLFEVLCGRLVRLREYTELTSLVETHWKRKTLDEIIYPDLQEHINQASLLTFATIAYQCLMSLDKRPTMKIVVGQLQKALDKQLATSGLWWNDDIAWAAQDHQGQSGVDVLMWAQVLKTGLLCFWRPKIAQQRAAHENGHNLAHEAPFQAYYQSNRSLRRGAHCGKRLRRFGPVRSPKTPPK